MIVSVKGLTYKYPGASTPALDNISLELNQGDAVCIMGGNGSGKTTLAHVLAGLLDSYQGEITIGGESPVEVVKSGKIGLLFQDPDNQLVATTVEEELAFTLENRQYNKEEIKSRIEEVAGKFRIGDLLKRLTNELSGGEKQKICLASLMIVKPDLLILDEPCSFLDPSGRASLKEELTRLCDEDSAIVQVRITQFPSVALDYERLIVLERGRIIADSEPKEALLCFSSSTRSSHAISHPETLKSRNAFSSLKGDNISYGYDPSDPIVESCSLDLKAGKAISVVGPSGSGKTTIGLLLCGLLKAQEGTVALVSSDGTEVLPAKRPGTVVALLQMPERQFFLQSCREEIAYGPENIGIDKTTVDLDRLFNMVDLDPLIFTDRDPLTLSMGEKRRLALAAVLSMRPSFVILDEPTTALDLDGVRQFVNMSLNLKKHGIGQLIISHEGFLVKMLADEVLLVSLDESPELYSTKQFLSQPELLSQVMPPNEYDSFLPDSHFG